MEAQAKPALAIVNASKEQTATPHQAESAAAIVAAPSSP
jgi:hypothetical protein